MTVAKPVSSSTVSPRMRSATSSAASWDGVASPSITWVIASRACWRVRVEPSTMAARARRTASLTGPLQRVARPCVAKPVAAASSSTSAWPSPVRRRKLARIRGPAGVSTDSGWNCTPSRGRSRWRIAMTTPSAVRPVTSMAAGRVALVDRQRVVAGGRER